MSHAPDYPFATLTDDELRQIIAGSRKERAASAVAAFRGAWTSLRWLFAPAGRPWRDAFHLPRRIVADPPRAHC
jgi:hypothetical protein